MLNFFLLQYQILVQLMLMNLLQKLLMVLNEHWSWILHQIHFLILYYVSIVKSLWYLGTFFLVCCCINRPRWRWRHYLLSLLKCSKDLNLLYICILDLLSGGELFGSNFFSITRTGTTWFYWLKLYFLRTYILLLGRCRETL